MPTETATVPPKGFGRRNTHCNNCGDERGGPFGHDSAECRYRSGMTAAEVAALLPEHRRAEFWDLCIDRYLAAKWADVEWRYCPRCNGDCACDQLDPAPDLIGNI